MIRARMFAIACGYEDCDDLDALRFDPALKLSRGRLVETGDALTAAQLGDTVLTPQAYADLLFCQKSPACRPADISDDLLRRLLGPSGFLSHLHLLTVTMSQKSSFIQYPLSVS